MTLLHEMRNNKDQPIDLPAGRFLVTAIIPTLCEAARRDRLFGAIDSLLDQGGVSVKVIVVVNGDRYDPALVEELRQLRDLHVLLSRNEGFGISTIEAMSCGVPAIGTYVPGTRDILRNSRAGILVPLNDESATAEAVSRVLINTDLCRTLAAAGRTLAVGHYSRARWLEEIAKYYDEILTRIGNRPCA